MLRHQYVLMSVVFSILSLTTAAGAQNVLLVPSQFSTIQGALNAALPGDRIEVSPGTYVEQIDFLGKAVELVAVGGWQVTMISGGNLPGRVVSFINGESSGAVIKGFRISYALLTVPGASSTGGIECIGSSPIIRKCVIRDNSTRSPSGGGISISGGAPLIEDCYVHANSCQPSAGYGGGNGGGIAIDGGANVVIRRTAIVDNIVSGYGGGIDIRGASTATIESCRISDNQANGDVGGFGAGLSLSAAGVTLPPSTAVVTSTLIDSNVNTGFAPLGGGVYSLNGLLTLVNCTVAHNFIVDLISGGSGSGIGGGALFSPPSGTIQLYNTIVWGNFSISYAFMPLVLNQPQIPNLATLAYCCVEGITPTGTNISLDPLFAGPFDFRLSAASPCRDTGSFNVPYIAAADDTLDPRIIGPAIDRGADEFPAAVLGSTGSPLDGNIGAAAGLLTNTLFLNGRAGDARRRETLAIGLPLTLSITPPTAWGPTPYALLAQTTTAHATQVFPFQSGILAMIPPHLGYPNEAVVLATSVALPGGVAPLPSAPLPVTLTSPGLFVAGEILIQAVVIDPQGLMLTTNGIDLTIQ